jgi:hypothetical protein
MAHFLVQASYTSEAFAAMMQNPEDKRTASGPLITPLSRRLFTDRATDWVQRIA